MRKIRNGMNRVCGWMAWALVLGLTLANDTLGVFGTWAEDPGEQGDLASYFYIAGFATISIGSAVMFARPFVGLKGDVTLVRNPLRDYVFTGPALNCTQKGVMYPSLRVPGMKRIRIMALEQSLLDDWLGVDRLKGQGQEAPAEVRLVSTRWVTQDFMFWIVISPWVAYVVIGFLYGAQGTLNG